MLEDGQSQSKQVRLLSKTTCVALFGPRQLPNRIASTSSLPEISIIAALSIFPFHRVPVVTRQCDSPDGPLTILSTNCIENYSGCRGNTPLCARLQKTCRHQRITQVEVIWVFNRIGSCTSFLSSSSSSEPSSSSALGVATGFFPGGSAGKAATF